MNLFWDTSAILALVLEEGRSPLARMAQAEMAQHWAWRWIQVEAEAALWRRAANRAQVDDLAAILKHLEYIEIEPWAFERVRDANRSWKLRAADAGHFYCFDRLATVLPGVRLVCFDEEMVRAARRKELSVWQPSTPGDKPGGRVRERRAVYRTRAKTR